MTHVSQKNTGRWNLALLGAGYISEWHAKAIQRLKNLRLAAVCDKSETRAADLAAAFRIPVVYSDIDAVANDPGIDAVHVLLPPDLHFPIAKKMLEAGKNVFLEKPMCLNATDCQELTQIADDRGVRVGVGHNFLFHHAYESLRRDVRTGRLGWITHVTVTWHKELPQMRHGPFGIWMLREPGNVALEIGSHAVAYVHDLVGLSGDVSIETSNPKTLSSGATIPRNLEIRLVDGATSSLIRLALGPGFPEHSVHVRGTLGSATADMERNTYVLRTHSALPDDFNRYRMVRDEAAALRHYAYQDIRDYVLSKAIKRIPGNSYGRSIQSAIAAFYAPTFDERLSGTSGEQVIDFCCRVQQAIQPVASDRQERYQQSNSATTASTHSQPKVLILGATGFIGQELCRQLINAGHSVRILVRDPGKLSPELRTDNVEIVRGDLSNSSDIAPAMSGIEYVYHLARAMVKTWPEYEKQDIEVTRNIAQQCIDGNVKLLIFTGTIDSYYAGASAGRIDESTGYDPKIEGRNLYARCKAVSEDLLMTLHRERNLPVAIFRPGIVIGRGGSPYHWGIGMWHSDSVCQVWGNGENPLPLVLVEDVASGLVRAVQTDGISGKSFNLIGDPVLSAREYLDELEKYAGIQLQRQYVSPMRFYAFEMFKWMVKCLVRHPERRLPTYRDWDSRTQRAIFDCERTKRELNWHPESDRAVLIDKGIHVPIDEVRNG